MKKAFSVAAIALSFFAAGCAIHPVPQDVTGVDTYHIVRQIRCEARETIRLEVIRWLNKMAAAGDPRAQKLALQYESYPDSISNFHYDLFNGPEYVKVRSVAKLFYDAGIAYNFDLTMTENNDLMTGLSFLKPLTEPVFTLGVNAGAKRQRSNNRTFTVTDTFSYLLTKLNTEVRGVRYCDGQLVQANYVYPIAGHIGIDKMVRDFIELTLFASLQEPTAAAGTVGAPTMVDKLTFTTAINGSVNPMVVFTPVTSAFQLTNASLTASADRRDMHEVSVGLAIATSDITELGSLRSFLFSSGRGARTADGTATGSRGVSPVVVGRRVTGGGRTASEVLAVIAIDQIKSRELQLIQAP
jgi:hypothetical protein